MARHRPIVARNGLELARILGLKPADAHEWEVQLTLLIKLRAIVKDRELTHAQLAAKAGTSRTRVTAVLNGNLKNVSSDLLIRMLGSLGFCVRVSVVKDKAAA